VLEADRVVAVIGKTEGNRGVNDYTRIIADRAFREVIAAQGSRRPEQVREIPIVRSGGTDGVPPRTQPCSRRFRRSASARPANRG
jgi:hypothetical protein